MTTLNNHDEIYQFNTQKPIAGLHDKTLEQKDFREIILGAKQEDSEQDLWLKLKDDDFTWNNLYLGRSKTFEKRKSPKKHNVVVPIIPRCYITPDRDPTKAVDVPEGWLYIVRQFESPQGTVVELWRELKSDGLGNFSDVNVKKFKGKDQRTATGQPGFRIIVPYCIDKEVHQLWIAYSEVQWSWNRIQCMKKDSKLREQRMHKLDLSDCLTNFDKCNSTAPPSPQKSDEPMMVKNVSGPALLYNLKSAPDPESKNLAKGFKEAIPVVYLDNPIGIGRRLAGDYQQRWQELTDCINNLRAIPELVNNPGLYAEGSSKLAENNAKRYGIERWFEAAALANRYFYSKISKEIPPGVKDKDAYKKRLTEIEEQFIQYQNMLDKTTIEQAIGMQQRKAIREKLVQAREKLVNFLQEELAAIKPVKAEGETQDPPLVLALDDYFTLSPLGDRERKQNPTDVIGDNSTPRWRDNYLDGWGAVYNLVALLGKHEYSIDADLEANPPDGWDWRRKNPAFELLRKLADPEGGFPLHSRLFPKAAAGKALKIDAAKVEDTATVFKIQQLGNVQKLNKRDADICKGLNLFGSNFNELMAMRDRNDPAYEKDLERAQNSILRLIQGAFQLEFQKTTKPLAELIAEAEKQLDGNINNEGIPAKEAFLKLAGFLQKTLDTADEDPTFAQSARKGLRNIRVGVIRAADNRRIRQLLRDLSDDRFVSSGLGGILGLVEIYNFNESLKAFSNNRNEDKNWELFAPLAAGFLKIPSAIKDVKDAAVAAKAAEGVGRTATRRTIVEMRSQISTRLTAAEIIKTASIVGDLIDMGLTLSSFTENLAQNDDAAIADAIGFTGATLGIIATVGSIPVLGWVAGLVGIAAWLAKVYLFKEDTPVELWINNGPFARGEEYHEVFCYKRTTTIKKVRDAKGNWVDTACAVHRYDNFEFLVDSGGTLVHAGPSQFHSPIQRCRVALDGTVYLKAGKWYDLRTNKWHEISADTTVATIGAHFTMHPLLQTIVKEKPQPKLTKKQFFESHDVRSCHARIAATKASPWEKWHINPHEAYLALADAAYRPRITLSEVDSNADNQCVLKVKLPFYIPGKSQLFIEFEQKDEKQKAILSKMDSGNIDNLKVGPGEYENVVQFPFWKTKTFTAKVRLELLGKGEVQLPHEPLFCGADIETQIDELTQKGTQSPTETKWIVVEKIVTGKRKRGYPEDVAGVLIDNVKNVFLGN